MKVTEVEYIVQWAEEKRFYEQKYTDQVGVSDPQKDRESGADPPAHLVDDHTAKVCPVL